MLIATAVGSVFLAVLLSTFVAQQRAFAASLARMNAQGDENRVFGYLSRDLRQASSIKISAGGTDVLLTIPSTSSPPPLNLNLGLSLLSILNPTAATPSSTSVEYYRQGTAVIRSVNGKTSTLTASATQFQVILAGRLAQIVMAFPPQLSFENSSRSPATGCTTQYVDLPNLSQ